jgi:glycogen(starch) synthase
MQGELQRVFQIPNDKLRIIPNGVYPAEFRNLNGDPAKVRSRYCAQDEKMLFYVGRIVREKGLGVLLDAFSRVLAVEPKSKLVIAGKGPYLDELRHRAYQLGIYNRIYFAGYIDDLTRNALYASAEVAVFPSLYEPFGIVALEGMAAGSAVLVSDTGGLTEIIQHGVNGLKAYCNNASSLADNLIWALQHPDHTKQMKAKAFEDIEKIYNWDRIAARTIEVYQETWEEYRDSDWKAIMHERPNRAAAMSRMVETTDAEAVNRYRDLQ